MGDSGGSKGPELKEVRPKSSLTYTDIAPSVTDGDTDIRAPLSVRRRGRGSARPGALSFHQCSAPFLKAPRSATPGDARVESGSQEGLAGSNPQTFPR